MTIVHRPFSFWQLQVPIYPVVCYTVLKIGHTITDNSFIAINNGKVCIYGSFFLSKAKTALYYELPAAELR